MAYETWMLSFAIDLEPYHTHLDLLETEVDYFMSSVVEVSQSYDQSTRSNDTQFKALHGDIDRLTIQEVNSCKLEIMGLRNNYHQLANTFLRPQENGDPGSYPFASSDHGRIRERRSLVPWLGKILSGLTGTVTQDELDRVREHIKVLADRSEVVTQVVQESLTVINATRADVRLNREAITHLGHLVSELTQKLRSLYSDVILTLKRELVYDQFLNRAHTAFHIIQNQLRQTSASLNKIRLQLESAMLGTLAFDMIQGAQLRGFLGKIERILPPNYVLPYGSHDLKPYYSQVPALVLSDENVVYVVLAVPIAPLESRLTIYQPQSVPFPGPNNDVAYHYKLEADALAVSADGYSFRLLSHTEAALCTQQGVKFCKFNQATFRTSQSQLCITALYMKDQKQITQRCPVITTPVPTWPTIRYLFDGKWLMFSPIPEEAQVSCANPGSRPSQQPSIHIKSGVSLITLPMSCSARTRSYMLPAYYRNETTYEIRESFELEILFMKRLNLFTNSSTFINVPFPSFEGADVMPALPEIWLISMLT